LGYSESRLQSLYSEKLSIIKQSLGSYYESNDELLFYCPKCKHHKRKMSVNVEKNVFKCWICDFRGTDLIKVITNNDLKSKWRQLTQQVDVTRFSELSEMFYSEDSNQSVDYVELPEHFSTLTTHKLSSTGQRAKTYLLSRGVTHKHIMMYKMGFCYHGTFSNRIIIPSYDSNGVLNYFIARSFNDKAYKYKNPKCSKDVVFNDIFIDWEQPITLVEGFFDSIKYDNSIPILGSTLNVKSQLFKKIVDRCKTVYICLDKDAKRKELKIIKNLLDFGVKVYKIEIYDYPDLAEVPESLLWEYKKRASIMTREDYLLQKLNFGG